MSAENPEDFCVCGARRKAHLAPFSGCDDFEPFEGPTGQPEGSDKLDQEVAKLDAQLDRIIASPPCEHCGGNGRDGWPCGACGNTGKARSCEVCSDPAETGRRFCGKHNHWPEQGKMMRARISKEEPEVPMMAPSHLAAKIGQDAFERGRNTGYAEAITFLRSYDAPIARACANLLEENKPDLRCSTLSQIEQAAEHLRTWQRQAGPGHPLGKAVRDALVALGKDPNDL